MDNFLRSLALITVATMGMTAVNAGTEWRAGKEQAQCHESCEMFKEIDRENKQVKDPHARRSLELLTKKIHHIKHHLKCMNEGMCPKCKEYMRKHEHGKEHREKCMRCEPCKHEHMHKHKEHPKHERHEKHVRKYKKVVTEENK